MMISSRDEYRAAVERASALSDAPGGSAEAEEFRQLTAEIGRWNEEHKGENSHGPEPADGLLRPDDLPFSGLPGNLGKLEKD
ncbi:hypothetical protein ASE63_22935 [Bosea sp. Root381]|uniref:hypothetical protein n=1 Tax=Bosea sp. Root381 TaxID=1736524 RepID=UPI0006F63FED|nr:hypothetical protein [Bosea sp. Root381]KRE07553.1 hypothetical protein ASE63_22935 [Bosea sp. Root381]